MSVSNMNRRKALGVFGALPLLAMGVSSRVLAQGSYPTKAVRLVVPFPPGGTTDTVSRRVAQQLSELWGQSVVVENKPGAGTSIGVDQVAKANPDGYTLGTVTGSFTVNRTLMAKLPYDTERDLRAVALMARSDHILVVHPSLGVNSVDDLVKLAKSKPGQLAYASFGNGSSAHLAGEMLKLDKGIDLIHVPYKGQGPALIDLVGGQVQMMFANLPEALPLMADGRIKALGVAANERSTFAPKVPTLTEQGLAIESSSWSGLIAASATPDAVVEKINSDVNKVLNDPALRDGFAKGAIITTPATTQAFADFLKKEMDHYGNVIKKANIVVG